jgi:acetyl esterase/lipase
MLSEFFMQKLIPWVIACLYLTRGAALGESNASYRQQLDVIYHQAHGVALVADIFSPNQKSNGHAIVVVASGAWHSDRGKIRDLDRSGLFEELCKRGFYVFALRPGSITHFSAHDMKAHVETGIRWVKHQADDLNFNPSKLGLIGASAGGHLASLTAVTQMRQDPGKDASVSAVGVFFPPTDFLDYGGVALDPRKEGRLHQILGSLVFREFREKPTDQQVREQSISISPARLVHQQAPPFLVIHGDADPVVPLQQSQALVKALQQHNVSAQLIIKEGGGHPWPSIREEVVVMADWFVAQLTGETSLNH